MSTIDEFQVADIRNGDETAVIDDTNDKDWCEPIPDEGRALAYKVDGEEICVEMHPLTDGGVYWKFIRGGRQIPLRLSSQAMCCMNELWGTFVMRSSSPTRTSKGVTE